MKVLSVDIGTSKICALVFDDESGETLDTLRGNNAFIPGRPWERIQDPEAIFDTVQELTSALLKKHRVGCVGISGQMHGVLYVDSSGRALSPLYTWQDGSGALPYHGGETCAEHLAKTALEKNPQRRYTLAPGYGLVTYFSHRYEGTLPRETAKLCTVGDYAAMRLCGAPSPVMHATNAGGLGFFDPRSLSFDYDMLEAAGIDGAILPRPAKDFEAAGCMAGIPVAAAIGDNQAGFLGSVRAPDRGVLVNMGTGGQVSLTDRAAGAGDGGTGGDTDGDAGGDTAGKKLERRPFFEGQSLYAGSSLCGGGAYAMLEEFFRAVLRMAGFPAAAPLYAAMEAALAEPASHRAERLEVTTLFDGTRHDPSLRGAIRGISRHNFTPASLIRGFLEGMAGELYDMLPGTARFTSLSGSGNAVRRNRFLREIIAETFGLPLAIPLHEEEAAFGAALYALIAAGRFSGVTETRRFVSYA